MSISTWNQKQWKRSHSRTRQHLSTFESADHCPTPDPLPSIRKKKQKTALVWLRTSLRVSDNQALSQAALRGREGLAVVCTWDRSIPDTPSAAFECAAVRQLDRTLRERYGHHVTVICTKDNDPVTAVCSVVERLQPATIVVDCASGTSQHLDLERALLMAHNQNPQTSGIPDIVPIWDDGTLLPFSQVPKALGRSRRGGRIFRWSTFLSHMMMSQSVPLPRPAPASLPPPLDSPDNSDALPTTTPTAGRRWSEVLMNEWGEVSEEEALRRATTAVAPCGNDNKSVCSDRKDIPSTSLNTTTLGDRGAATHKSTRLSPYLRWGVISPRQAYHAGGVRLRDLLWRDWSYACYRIVGPLQRGEPVLPILDNCCSTTVAEGQLLFDNETDRFAAWCLGQTGAPLVDAGMRQLWYEGWMPRNVRLLAASCLVEGMGVDWRKGRDWFDHTLIDHDPAINELMWQNAGFCGLDTFYRGLAWEKEAEHTAMAEGPDYIQRWMSQELTWPFTLSQYKATLPVPAHADVVAAACARREELKRRGLYKAAARVANTGVRVAWEDLECGSYEVPVGEVWGIGRVPIDNVSFDLSQGSENKG